MVIKLNSVMNSFLTDKYDLFNSLYFHDPFHLKFSTKACLYLRIFDPLYGFPGNNLYPYLTLFCLIFSLFPMFTVVG